MEDNIEVEIKQAKDRQQLFEKYAIRATKVKIKKKSIIIKLENGIKLKCPLNMLDIDTSVYGVEAEIIGFGGTIYFPGNNEYISVEGLVLDIITAIPGCIVSHRNRF